MAASGSRRGRLWELEFDSVFVPISLASGFVLVAQSDRWAQGVGVGVLMLGGLTLVDLVKSLFPSDLEKLATDHKKLEASGASTETVVKQTEEKLNRAGTSRRTAPWFVGFRIVMGGVYAGVGTYLLVANPSANPWQSTWGTVMVLAGLPALALGIVDVFPSSPSKSGWWAIYNAGKPSLHTHTGPAAAFSATVMPHGVAGAFRLTF